MHNWNIDIIVDNFLLINNIFHLEVFEQSEILS